MLLCIHVLHNTLISTDSVGANITDGCGCGNFKRGGVAILLHVDLFPQKGARVPCAPCILS